MPTPRVRKRSGRFACELLRIVHYPGKAHNAHLACSRLMQRLKAGIGRRATRHHIVHQQDLRAPQPRSAARICANSAAQNPRAQMYMDSLELSTYGLGGMFWGASVAEEFRRRRGYPIEPWLPFLTRSEGQPTFRLISS